MTSPDRDGPTILPTDRDPAGERDPVVVEREAVMVERDPVVERDPGLEREPGFERDPMEDDVPMPATPGAAAMPVPHDPVTPEPASASASTGAHAPTAGDQDWLALQGRFVDDPAAAVREAGERVTKEFENLRARLEAGSTEDLRTAFQRYRSLHEALDREAAL